MELDAAFDLDGRPLLAVDEDVGGAIGQVHGHCDDGIGIGIMLDLQLAHLLDKGCGVIRLQHGDKLALHTFAQAALDEIAQAAGVAFHSLRRVAGG